MGGIFKKLSLKDNGYYHVCLYKNGKGKHFHIHRLVGQMFIENDDPLNKNQINHINEDKSDNRASNLEWCTSKENMNHGTRTSRHKKQVSGSKGAWSRRIKCKTTGEIFEALTEAGKKYNIFPQNIGEACKRKTHSGKLDDGTPLEWEYLDDVKYIEFKNYYAINVENGEVIFIENSKMAKELGFEIRYVNKCFRGKSKTHKGYKFVKEIDVNE